MIREAKTQNCLGLKIKPTDLVLLNKNLMRFSISCTHINNILQTISTGENQAYIISKKYMIEFAISNVATHTKAIQIFRTNYSCKAIKGTEKRLKTLP